MEPAYNDLIIFTDEDDIRKELFVQILDTTNLIKFQTKGGNVISIPSSSVIKIKQRFSDEQTR